MEKKDSKFQWKKKNNGTMFGLCLMGVAAFSVLLATGQVRQARKEKEQLLQEQAVPEYPAVTERAASEIYRVDEAPNLAAEKTLPIGNEPEQAEEMTENLEAAVSGEITVQMEEAEKATVAETEEVLQESGAAEEPVTAQPVQVQPAVTFDENGTLRWPVAGNVVLDYSMDGCVYFPTLQQYKYNPALIIGSEEGAKVIASARGIVEKIGIDEETGTTVTMNLGNGYKLKYGQLQELTVNEGNVVEEGELIGYVSRPTKYYCREGNNLYFAMTREEQPVDPVLYLE